MFNRQPFNRTVQENTGASGIASMIMGAIAVLNKKITINGSTSMRLNGTCNLTNNKSLSSTTNMILKGFTNGTKELFVIGEEANMVLDGSVAKSLSGESIIHLENLTLHKGDELIINTSEMTVTLNGENAMEYFSSDSEFFELITGANTIVYNDNNTSREVSINITWKDRWL